MAAVEEFCLAAQKRYPNCLVQFEDFPTDKARGPHSLRSPGRSDQGIREISRRENKQAV